MKVPKHCPLVLLVKVGSRRKGFGSRERKEIQEEKGEMLSRAPMLTIEGKVQIVTLEGRNLVRSCR
jgi:hypothetical protein